MSMGIRNSTDYHKTMAREKVSSEMRMKPEQEKFNTWPLTILTTYNYISLLISAIGFETLSKIMCNENFTRG